MRPLLSLCLLPSLLLMAHRAQAWAPVVAPRTDITVASPRYAGLASAIATRAPARRGLGGWLPPCRRRPLSATAAAAEGEAQEAEAPAPAAAAAALTTTAAAATAGVETFAVESSAVPMDIVLARRFPQLSRRACRRLLQEGFVRVDGKGACVRVCVRGLAMS